MARGQMLVLCNLGVEPVKLENPGGFPLVLASRDDVEVTDGKVLLPPDSIAILSSEEA